MSSRKMVLIIVTCIVFGLPANLPAEGTDPAFILSLAQLPSVTAYQLDDQGRLTLLEGELAGPAAVAPDLLVRTFVGTQPSLYPRAQGTAFEVESVSTLESGWVVVVRQVVGGFWVDGYRLVCSVGADGVLRRIDGVVIPDADVDQSRGTPMQRFQAMGAAKAALFGAAGVPSVAGKQVAAEATPLLDPQSGLKRWRVEFVFTTPRGAIRYTALLDATSGQLVHRKVEDVSALVGRRLPQPISGGGVTPVGGGTRVADVPTVSCAAFDPPPGDFSTAGGVQDWDATGLQSWGFNWVDHCGIFQTGWRQTSASGITRSSVEIPGEARRVQIGFPHLDRQTSFVFRWGPTEAQSVAFDAPAMIPITPPGGGPDLTLLDNVQATLYLDANSSWLDGMTGGSSVTRDLMLEVKTGGTTGKIANIGLYPGAEVRFVQAPVLYIGDQVAQTYGAGAVMRLHQQFVNNGCDMVSSATQLDGGTEVPRPDYAYTLYKLDAEGNRLPDFDPIPLDSTCSGEFSATFPARGTADLDLCSVTLPAAEQKNLGLWELEGVLTEDDGATVTSTTSLVFDLLDQGVPDLRLQPDETVDSWDQSTGHRVTRVQRGESFPLNVVVRSDQYPSNNVALDVWARQSVPNQTDWVLVHEETFSQLPIGPTPVNLSGLSLGDDVLPEDQSWGLVDLRLTVSTTQDELSYSNNQLNLPQWIPVYGGPSLAASVGSGVLVPWLLDEFDSDDPNPDLLFTSVNAWTLEWTQGEELQFEGAQGTEQPRLGWAFPKPSDDLGSRIGAVILRYRRRLVGSSATDANLGLGWDTYNWGTNGGDGTIQGEWVEGYSFSFPITMNSISDNNQWHTAVWVDGDMSGAEWSGLPILSIPPGTDAISTAEEWASLQLTTDGSCVPAWVPGSGTECIDYPQQYLDFVEVLRKPGAPVPPDVQVDGVVLNTEDEGWVDLPAIVGVGQELQLGVVILLRGDATAPPVGKVTLQIEDPNEGVTTLEGYQTETLDGRLVYRMRIQGVSNSWSPQSAGSHLLTAEATVEEANQANNHWTGSTCASAGSQLDLPTQVVQ